MTTAVAETNIFRLQPLATPFFSVVNPFKENENARDRPLMLYESSTSHQQFPTVSSFAFCAPN